MRGILLALCIALAAAWAEPAHSALPRSEVDRLDDVRGPQIHFLYVVPADGEDRGLDQNGTLAASVAHFQGWLAGQTGGANLRVDTYQGELDINFKRLAQTDAELAAGDVREGLEQRLNEAGFVRPNRIYAVYYDGSSRQACGGAFWPPEYRGNTVAMYLRRGLYRCDHFVFAPPGAPPKYWEFAMLHDIVHGLGYVARCAPHFGRDSTGHVSDFVNDLMYTGPGGWELPPTLDVGRDDYYGHGRADCPDLARSPYLTSTPPQPPVLEVKTFAAELRARPGRTIRAQLEVALDAEPVVAGASRCAAKLGTRALRPLTASFSGSTARCSWRLPATARGKRLTGSVQAVVGSLSARRTFTRVVR
jgi:hypothetical protein